MKRTTATTILLMTPVLLGACAGSAEPTLLPAASPPATTVSSPSPPASPDPFGELPAPVRPLVAQAARDLAMRTGVPTGQVGLAAIEATQWPDASLGCPQEGSDYPQVITPGYKLTLIVGTDLYSYHTDDGTLVVLCGPDGPVELPPIPIQPGEKIQDGEPWMPVDPVPTVPGLEDEIVDPAPIK